MGFFPGRRGGAGGGKETPKIFCFPASGEKSTFDGNWRKRGTDEKLEGGPRGSLAQAPRDSAILCV